MERHAEKSLVRRCHRALLGSRVVAMTMAALDGRARQMTWLGVGNEEGVLLRADHGGRAPRHAVQLRGETVAHRFPGLRTVDILVAPGEFLVLATDGISSRFTGRLAQSLPPPEAADLILAQHWRATDDALLLVARYLAHSNGIR